MQGNSTLIAVTLITGLLLASFSPTHVDAADYPVRSVRLIVPFAPGGGTDIIARMIAQRVASSLGQQIIVDNRPGASANIAHGLTARATPDGYTVLITSGNFVVNPGLIPNNPYDATKDFEGVTYAAISPNVLIVHPSFPTKSVKEFVASIRANPGKHNFASPSTGTTSHLAAELLKLEGKLDMSHVPFNGAAPALVAILGNQVPIGFVVLPSAQSHINTGQLRGLAVTTAQRFPPMPDLPTIAESGFPGFEADTPQIFVMPAKTPKQIVVRWHSEIAQALRAQEVADRLGTLGYVAVATSPDETAKRIASDVTKWARVIKLSGIKPE